jgi:glutaredoxin
MDSDPPIRNPQSEIRNRKPVRVFTVPDCGRCRVVMKFLEDKNIAYETVSVENNFPALREMIRRTGSRTVPVTFVGEEFMIGMDLEALERLLRK